MTFSPMSPAEQFTVLDAGAARSARRAAREIRTIVSGTLAAGGVVTAAGIQWAARRAAAVARRRMETLGRGYGSRDEVAAVEAPDGLTPAGAGAGHPAP